MRPLIRPSTPLLYQELQTGSDPSSSRGDQQPGQDWEDPTLRRIGNSPEDEIRYYDQENQTMRYYGPELLQQQKAETLIILHEALETAYKKDAHEEFSAIDESNITIKSFVQEAQNYRKMRRTLEASRILQKAFLQFPNHHLVLDELGHVALKMKEYQLAEKFFIRERELYPHLICTYVSLARCSIQQGKFQETIQQIGDGLRIDHTDEGLMNLRTQYREELERFSRVA